MRNLNINFNFNPQEDIELAKDVLMYHIIPYNLIYDGASDEGSIGVNTKLSDESSLAAVCEGKPEYSSMFRFGIGFSKVVAGGSEASFVEKDLAFCGPVIVHVVDTVLLPCAL
jgi:Fasciclin domain